MPRQQALASSSDPSPEASEEEAAAGPRGAHAVPNEAPTPTSEEDASPTEEENVDGIDEEEWVEPELQSVSSDEEADEDLGCEEEGGAEEDLGDRDDPDWTPGSPEVCCGQVRSSAESVPVLTAPVLTALREAQHGPSEDGENCSAAANRAAAKSGGSQGAKSGSQGGQRPRDPRLQRPRSSGSQQRQAGPQGEVVVHQVGTHGY